MVMVNNFFARLDSLQDSHVGAGSFKKCCGWRRLAVILNWWFTLRWDQIDLDWRPFVDIEPYCKYLTVAASCVHSSLKAIVDIGFNSNHDLPSMEYLDRAVLAHDRLGRCAALQIYSHPFDWSRNHHLVLAGDRCYSYSVGNCFSSGCDSSRGSSCQLPETLEYSPSQTAKCCLNFAKLNWSIN